MGSNQKTAEKIQAMKFLRFFKISAAVSGLVVAALSATVGPAAAQFQKSDDALFVGGPELISDPEPGSETFTYAIVDDLSDNVFYLILYSFKGAITVKGAFRCDNEFSVLKSETDGWRDIRCTSTDVFGRRTTSTLSMGDNGDYVEYN